MIEDGIEHETVVASVITSNKPSESCHIDCQIHTYFSHEKKSTHLLKLNLFPKKSQETEVEFIVVTPNVSSSNGSLEFFAIFHQVTLSVSSSSECLEFFEFVQVSVSSSNVISLALFDVHSQETYISFFPIIKVIPCESDAMYLHVTHDKIPKQIAICNSKLVTTN